MSKILFLVLSIFAVALHANSQLVNRNVQKNAADSVLQAVSNKLNNLQSIDYRLTTELNYLSENYHQIVHWNDYYDFQSTDTTFGFKYQIDDSISKQIFNGTEEFTLDTKEKTISVNHKPEKNVFEVRTALFNSIITIKNIIPLVLADKTIRKNIKDTIIDHTTYCLIGCNVGKRGIQYLGKGFDSITRYNLTYKMIVDKKNDLPFELLQTNDLNGDFIKTSFTNVETNPKAPSEQSWFYTTYLNEYKPAKEIAVPSLLPVGASAPEWKLKLYNQDKTISLVELKGKVVMLDFWIKNCGPCIESVPQLNEWQQKFDNKNFKIVSINSYDSKEDVQWFCNKHNVSYDVVFNGEPVFKKYGIDGFPTFFILDKNGKILYAKAGYGKTSKAEIEKIIEQAL